MQRNVIDAGFHAVVAISFTETGDLFEVVCLDRVGVNFQDLARFIVFQLEHAVEGKFTSASSRM